MPAKRALRGGCSLEPLIMPIGTLLLTCLATGVERTGPIVDDPVAEAGAGRGMNQRCHVAIQFTGFATNCGSDGLESHGVEPRGNCDFPLECSLEFCFGR